MGRVESYESYYKARMDKLLLALVGSEDLVNKWWLSPNKAFDMQQPADVYEQDPKKVINYILSQYQY